MNKPINILVTGCNGRMGKAIINCASNHSEVLITKGIDIGDALDDYIDDCDVVIDFSTHTFTTELVEKCVSKDKSIVIKGCSNKKLPISIYYNLSSRLLPIAKSIMYGEACSAVPVFKGKA